MEIQEEFDWLFAQEYPAVVWTVNVILHDYARAEDVTQDAFVRLLENWDKVSRYDRPGAWVRRVAIRMATRTLGRELRRPRVERAGPRLPEPEPFDVDLVDAIQQLTPRQRAVVVLYYFEDRPVQEVADLVDCSASTVTVHLHRARQRLAEILGEEVEAHVDR